MDPTAFQSDRTGRVTKTPAGYYAFVPNPLPPQLTFSQQLIEALSTADRAIGRLDGLSSLLPNPYLLIRPFLAREAVLSSRIEGTQASLSDLFLFEAAPEQPPAVPDVREVANYVKAMEYGLDPGRELPLSLRLIRELHRHLMEGVRGDYATPGEFRRSQNWIGPAGYTLKDATFVPPPIAEMHECLGAFENFLHAPAVLPPLVWLALVHAQFEMIHPFLDGNGRIGRLLVSLMLCERGVLRSPLLYLSAFFERNRATYYDRLLGVSQHGAWEDWIAFFLEGVATQAEDASQRTDRLRALGEEYRLRLAVARSSGTLLKLVDELFARPMVTTSGAARVLGLTYQGAALSIGRLVSLGILTPAPRRRRPRIYVARQILALLSDDLPAPSPKDSAG